MKHKDIQFQEYHLGVSRIELTQAWSFDTVEESTRKKPWIAKITGIDKQYGYKREFVKSKRIRDTDDYFKIIWELEAGFVYEFKNFLLDVSASHFGEGLVGITKDYMVELKKGEVRKYLHMRGGEDG